MKPAHEWATEFLSKHVLNTRESGEFERFVESVQKDVISSFERSILVTKDIEGIFYVGIGEGRITFTINPYMRQDL